MDDDEKVNESMKVGMNDVGLIKQRTNFTVHRVAFGLTQHFSAGFSYISKVF